MENKLENLIRKSEVAHITLQKFDCRIDSQVWHSDSEGVGISCQHGCRQIKPEFAVAVN